MARLENCWHGCSFKHCRWLYVHQIPETTPPDDCPYWKLCPTHARFKADCVNFDRKIYDAKKIQGTKNDSAFTSGATAGREARWPIMLAQAPENDAQESIAGRKDLGYALHMENQDREIWSLRQVASDDWHEKSIV